jgi:hypothetical protein
MRDAFRLERSVADNLMHKALSILFFTRIFDLLRLSQ